MSSASLGLRDQDTINLHHLTSFTPVGSGCEVRMNASWWSALDGQDAIRSNWKTGMKGAAWEAKGNLSHMLCKKNYKNMLFSFLNVTRMSADHHNSIASCLEGKSSVWFIIAFSHIESLKLGIFSEKPRLKILKEGDERELWTRLPWKILFLTSK